MDNKDSNNDIVKLTSKVVELKEQLKGLKKRIAKSDEYDKKEMLYQSQVEKEFRKMNGDYFPEISRVPEKEKRKTRFLTNETHDVLKDVNEKDW